MLLAVMIPIGLVIGAVSHQLLPKAELRGSLLLPFLGTATAGVIWTLFSWLGLEESGWIWFASILGSLLVSLLTGILLSNARDRKNQEKLATV